MEAQIDLALASLDRECTRPPLERVASARAAAGELAGALRGAGLTSVHLLLGSFGVNTQALPLHRVEVGVLLAPRPDLARASIALTKVATVVERESGVRDVRVGAHHVDAVATADGLMTRVYPLRERLSPNGVLVPCVVPRLSIDDWSYRNPERWLEAAEAYENDTRGVYSMACRLLDTWNRGAPNERATLTADHVEAMLWHSMRLRLTAPLSETLERFFEEAYWRLDPGARTPAPGWRMAPRLPGIVREMAVDDALSPDRRRRARARVSYARQQVREARAVADPAAAASIWRRLLTGYDSGEPRGGQPR